MKRALASLLLVTLAGCHYDTGLIKGSSTASGSTTSGTSTGTATATSASTSTSASNSSGASLGATVASSSSGNSASTASGSTSSTSSGNTFSSSGASTPVSNAGCESVDGGAQDHETCTTNADCACPFSCQTDPALEESDTVTVCLRPCSTDNDCPASTSFCTEGVCRARQCAFLNGGTGAQAPDGGFFWAACDAEGQGDGTCLPVGGGLLDVVGLCELTGNLPAGSSCSPLASRDAGPEAFCDQGLSCLNAETAPFESNPPFTCQAVCDTGNPLENNGCATGSICMLSLIAGTMDGQLPFAGGEAKYDVCQALGANECLQGVQDFITEWQACRGAADCTCEQGCTAAPLTQTSLCALPCSTTTDCSDPGTTCQGGFCWANLCDADAGAGTACNAAGTGDGVCIKGSNVPETIDPGQGFGAPEPQCEQTGSAALGDPCDASGPSRSEPNLLCQADGVCALLADGGGVCRSPCTYQQSGKQAECTSGEVCELTYLNTDAPATAYLNLGACYAQGASGCAEGWYQPGDDVALLEGVVTCAATADCPCPTTCQSGVCQ